MLFREIAGQEILKQKLRDTVKNQRVAHAQLFFGNEGVGKLPLAIAYAQFINCLDPGKFNKADSCGQCSSCHKFQKLIHPDLHFVYPVAASDASKKASLSIYFLDRWREILLEWGGYISSNEWFVKIGAERKQAAINVEECNQIMQTLNYTSYEAEYKIMIIWMAERLNYVAAPKLLKIIEEPPDKTLFLLVSNQPEQILPTILSRLLPVKVPPVDKESIATFLSNQFGIEQSLSYQYALQSDGNVTDAIRIARQNNTAGEMFEQFRNWMRLCYAADVQELIKFSDKAGQESRERLKSFLRYSLMVFRNSLVYHFSEDFLNHTRPEEKDFYRRFSGYIDQKNIIQIADLFNQAIFHIERNVHSGLVLLDLSFSLTRIFHQKKT